MGRPRGSRNRNTLARELMAAVNDQDSDFDPAIELCCHAVELTRLKE